MTWQGCPPGVIAQSVKVSIRPPVHVVFTHSHSCNSWIPQSYGWSEDWARRGRFSPIVKHETAQQLAVGVCCVLCVLTRITVIYHSTGWSLQWWVCHLRSDRRFAAAGASWWVPSPSLNYLLPEALKSPRLSMGSSSYDISTTSRIKQMSEKVILSVQVRAGAW